MVTRIGHQELLACNRNGRAERGDSANSTSVQRLTPTRIQTGRYEKTGLETHAKRLNRDSVVLGVGKPSNAQRGGRSGETRFKSDSPNWSRDLRSYVKFNVTTGRAQPVHDRPRRFIA